MSLDLNKIYSPISHTFGVLVVEQVFEDFTLWKQGPNDLLSRLLPTSSRFKAPLTA